MKKIFCTILTCFLFIQAQAQDKICGQTTKDLHSLVNTRQFNDAFLLWKDSEKCMVANDTIFADGERILLAKIGQSPSIDGRKDFIQSLFKLYDAYDKKYTGNTKSHAVKKAMTLKANKSGTSEEIYQLLDKAFKTDLQNFIDPKAMLLYYELYYKKFQDEKSGIAEFDVFLKQDEVTAQLEQLAVSNIAMSRNYLSAAEAVRKVTSSVATCEKLGVFYSTQYDTRKNDSIWVQNANRTLLAKNCTTSPAFLKLAERWFEINPNAKSANNVGIAYLRGSKPDKALKHFEIAASLEKVPAEKAKIYYTIAATLGFSKEVSVEYAKKAVNADPRFGKAYLLMAQLYSNSAECGKDDFEKKAINFLAADAARMAGVADPALKSSADKMEDTFLKKAPTKDEIKKRKAAGKKINFNCWIKESVTIPSK